MKKKITTTQLRQMISEGVQKLHKLETLKEEKRRIEKEISVLSENLTLQYADNPTKDTPVIDVDYSKWRGGLLANFGVKIMEDEPKDVNELMAELKMAKQNLDAKSQQFGPSDFEKEYEILEKLIAFTLQSKRDGNQTVMLTSNLAHNEDEWYKNLEDEYWDEVGNNNNF